VALIDSLAGVGCCVDFKWWNDDDDVWRAALSISESLKSGWGLFLVGSVCDLDPPLASNSRSLELRHFMRRFWNHIFTWNPHENKPPLKLIGSRITHEFCLSNFKIAKEQAGNRSYQQIVPSSDGQMDDTRMTHIRHVTYSTWYYTGTTQFPGTHRQQ